jgi:type III secretion system HrpE/YscL family protein
MIILLDPQGPGVLAADGIVRAHELGPLMEAAALMQQARAGADALLASAGEEGQLLLDAAVERAQQLKAEAEQQAEALREAARAEAEAARQMGYQSGEQQALEAWHEAHASLQQAQAVQRQGVEQALAEVVMQAVRRIVDAEPRESLFQRALKTVQGLAAVSGSAALRVAPSDADAARAARLGRAGAARPRAGARQLDLQFRDRHAGRQPRIATGRVERRDEPRGATGPERPAGPRPRRGRPWHPSHPPLNPRASRA